MTALPLRSLRSLRSSGQASGQASGHGSGQALPGHEASLPSRAAQKPARPSHSRRAQPQYLQVHRYFRNPPIGHTACGRPSPSKSASLQRSRNLVKYWTLAKNPFSHISAGLRPTTAAFWGSIPNNRLRKRVFGAFFPTKPNSPESSEI